MNALMINFIAKEKSTEPHTGRTFYKLKAYCNSELVLYWGVYGNYSEEFIKDRIAAHILPYGYYIDSQVKYTEL